MNLYEKLEAYGKSDYYPFHMPGHKRNIERLEAGNPYEIDITEIDGFDNLHHAEEILKEEMERASRLFGAEETYFLVNGSSCGLLAAVSACTRHGDGILVARNCHKSVYNGIFINELKPVYLYPQTDEKFGINLGILPEDVDNLLERNPQIKTVVIVSPTYEGVVSDIKKIAEIVHRHGGILIVDEAHGAHFPFHKAFPESAVRLGADIVIQSIHKTLPAFTQTALAHVQGARVDKNRFQQFLTIFQSSSPSYVLMAGISRCMRILEEEKEPLFEAYVKELTGFYEKAAGLKHILVPDRLPGWERDLSKLLISVKNISMTGSELYDILLHRYHLQMEMAQDSFVLAMTSVFDTKEGFERLFLALEEIDRELDRTKEKEVSRKKEAYRENGTERKQVCSIYEASLREKKKIPLEVSEGKTAGDYVFLYPPGIPLLCPGERIDRECLSLIAYYRSTGLRVHGISEGKEPFISVIPEEKPEENEEKKWERYML